MSYDESALNVLRELGESSIGVQLSPIVQLGVQVYGIADEIARASTDVDVGKLAVSLGVSILQQILPLISASIGGAAAAALPLIGSTIGAIVDAPPAALSDDEVAAGRQQQCLHAYLPVVATTASGIPSPADYFVATDPLTGKQRESWRKPAVGEALIAITETYGPLEFGSTEAAFGSQIGIRSATRALFSRLRHGIEAGYNTGTGGAELWPAYLDLLNLEWKAGRMSPSYARYLVTMSQLERMNDGNGIAPPAGTDAQDWIHLGGDKQIQMLATFALVGRFNTADLSWLPPDVCARWDQRGLDGALSLRTAWDHIVTPTYDLDKKALTGTLATAIRAILDATPDEPKNRLVLLALSIAAHEKKPRIRFPKPSSWK